VSVRSQGAITVHLSLFLDKLDGVELKLHQCIAISGHRKVAHSRGDVRCIVFNSDAMLDEEAPNLFGYLSNSFRQFIVESFVANI
jgi:hypothetical protein